MNNVSTSIFALMPSGMEWMWILLIVLLLFGGAKLPSLAKGLGQVIFDGVEGDELGAGALEAIHLSIDMGVVDADGGKFDVRHRVSVSYR